jgi:hypothetical protein
MRTSPRPAFAAALALAVSAALPRPTDAESGPRFRGEESQALGHTGVASSSGITALFLNPAALGRAEGVHAGLSGNVGLNSVLVDYASWASDNSRYFDDNDSLLAHIGPVDNKWAPFTSALYLHGSWEGIALAAVMDSRYEATVTKAVITPAVLGIGGLSDLVLTAGRGFAAEDGYRFGFALKYLYRLRYDRRLLGTTDEDWYTAKQAWEKQSHGLMDDLGKLQVAGDIAETTQGLGLNLGAEKDISKSWTAGLSLLDFPTVLDQRFARPDIGLGLSWHPAIDWVPDLDDRLVVNLDWQRFLIPGTPWFKQVKAGAGLEGRMKGRQVAYLGLGLNDGYPTLGVRVGYILYVSYVYTAEEIGTYPGQEKLSFHKLVVQAEY